jgi:hypothetical protein
LGGADPECPDKNAEYGCKRVNREIDQARMQSRDIELQNLNHRAIGHRPDAQNPLTPRLISPRRSRSGGRQCTGFWGNEPATRLCGSMELRKRIELWLPCPPFAIRVDWQGISADWTTLVLAAIFVIL